MTYECFGRDLIRLVVVVAIFGQLGTSALTVQTPSGKVIGYKSNNAQRFLGIQFAKAGRWQAPTLVTGNPSTIINATDYGPSCMQKPGYVPPNLSEDCLFINVYAPIWTTPTANLSVFVWIHGGGFLYGGSVSYPADDLVDLGNMIVVTFNYRLGPFGFMASATMAQENPQLNYGLQDQQLALLWVQKNIRYFGGNPDNVLIIGQSAGGASVLLHLLTKGSMGLFHKAYSMSPGALYDVKSTKQSFADAQKVEEAIGCASSADRLACLRAKSPLEILSSAVPVTLFVPIVDEVDLVQYPFDAFFEGNFNQGVPVVIGYTAEEGNLFAFLDSVQYGLDPYYSMNATQYSTAITFLLANNNFPSLSATVMEWYSGYASKLGVWYADSKIQGDFVVNCAADSIALSIQKHAPSTIFRYEYAHASSNWLFKSMNATHACDMAYVFHTDIAGTKFNSAEDKLSKNIIQYISNFLEAGNPSKGPYCGGLKEWPVYDGTLSTVQVLDLDIRQGEDPTHLSYCPKWSAAICPFSCASSLK